MAQVADEVVAAVNAGDGQVESVDAMDSGAEGGRGGQEA